MAARTSSISRSLETGPPNRRRSSGSKRRARSHRVRPRVSSREQHQERWHRTPQKIVATSSSFRFMVSGVTSLRQTNRRRHSLLSRSAWSCLNPRSRSAVGISTSLSHRRSPTRRVGPGRSQPVTRRCPPGGRAASRAWSAQGVVNRSRIRAVYWWPASVSSQSLYGSAGECSRTWWAMVSVSTGA